MKFYKEQVFIKSRKGFKQLKGCRDKKISICLQLRSHKAYLNYYHFIKRKQKS